MKDKSVGAALVLTFLFGPLGLLYSSVLGGLIMLVLGGFLMITTLGLAIVIVWPVSMLLGAVAASSKHSKYQAWLVGQTSGTAATPPPPPSWEIT